MTTTLRGGNVIIRRYTAEDVQACHEAIKESVKELSTWMTWCHPDFSLEETSNWVLSREIAWEEGKEYDFLIVDAEQGRILGTVGLNQINRASKFANLGYWVRTSATGKGVATAATRLAARFGLTELGLHRIEIVVATTNKASQRTAEKSGAQREGVLRKRINMAGQAYDAVMYSLVAEDLAD